jgi:hypothetical protein
MDQDIERYMDIRKTLQKPVSLFVSIILGAIALRLFWLAAVVHNTKIARSLLGTAFIALALFLVKQKRWALRTAAGLLVLTACLLPVAVFDPFAAGDHLAAGEEPPTISGSLVWIIPVELLLLFSVYILDPPKDPR